MDHSKWKPYMFQDPGKVKNGRIGLPKISELPKAEAVAKLRPKRPDQDSTLKSTFPGTYW